LPSVAIAVSHSLRRRRALFKCSRVRVNERVQLPLAEVADVCVANIL
jgi:hypothetical protein